MPLFFSRSDINDKYNYAMKMKESSDLCLFFHHDNKDFGVLNKQELEQQMRYWKKEAKAKKLQIREHNNQTKIVDGKEWHILVIQPYNDDKLSDYNPCLFGALVLNFMVQGYIYAFDNKNNRDMIYEYVMKGLK